MNPELKQGILLGAATAIALLIIVATYHATRSTISETERQELESKLTVLLEPDSYNNVPAADQFQITDIALGSERPQIIYRARHNGKPTGVVISAIAPDGYSGDIALLIGLNYDGNLTGVRVTSHRETPGLGDDIDVTRSDWIRSFENLAPTAMNDNDWQVKKDGGQFDQFTGATITPRAVVHAVHRVANWYLAQRDIIFASQTAGTSTQKTGTSTQKTGTSTQKTGTGTQKTGTSTQ